VPEFKDPAFRLRLFPRSFKIVTIPFVNEAAPQLYSQQCPPYLAFIPHTRTQLSAYRPVIFAQRASLSCWR
jgi:hypothetical protein